MVYAFNTMLGAFELVKYEIALKNPEIYMYRWNFSSTYEEANKVNEFKDL